MTPTRTFLNGFLIGLFIFIVVNALAAHLLSDCGLPAVLGVAYCSDAVARAGFPLVFFEQGGYAYRSGFNLPFLLLDLFIGIGFAVVYGFIASRREKRKQVLDT